MHGLTFVPSSSASITEITYDQAGRKESMTDADMGNWSYTYDALSNLKTQTDARGCILTMTYDQLSRLDTKTSSGGCGQQISVNYDYDGVLNGIGRRTSMTDSSGSTSWTYDTRGRLLSESKTITDAGTFNTSWVYNAAGLPKSMTYPVDNGTVETVFINYNDQMLPESIGSLIGSYASSMQYDPAGRMTHLTRGDDLLDTAYQYYPWDTEGGRLQSLTSTKLSNQTSLQNLAYTYDLTGNISTITDSNVPSQTQTQTFTYDALDRLKTAKTTGGTYGVYNEQYGYDSSTGNLITKGTLTLTYPSTPSTPCVNDRSDPAHAVNAAGDNIYEYDCNGSMVRRDINSGPLPGDYTLSYDAENRLVGVTKDGTNMASFVYDGDGRRVKSEMVTSLGMTTTYFVSNYYEVTGDGKVTKYYMAGAQRVAMRQYTIPQPSTLTYLLGDHLGSTSITTDDTGNLFSELRYKPWGEERYTFGSESTKYQYTGQFSYESDFGLYFYQSRWYDPLLGRFAQADSVIPGGVQGYDRYAYTNNNPVRYTDPSGHVVSCDAEEDCKEKRRVERLSAIDYLKESILKKFGVTLNDDDGGKNWDTRNALLAYSRLNQANNLLMGKLKSMIDGAIFDLKEYTGENCPKGIIMIREMRAAIFDLDGVIVDTAKYHYLAWKRLANELGFDFTEMDNERLKGVSRVRSLEILLEIGGLTLDEATRSQLAARKNDWYVDYISRMDASEILSGAADYLQHIRLKGVKTALGSASKNAPLILDRLGISSLFDAIVDGNKVSKAKPDPEVFLCAAQELNVSPTECVVFEDAEAGIEAAIRAGMGTVGIGKPSVLKDADVVIGGLYQLLIIS